VGKKAKPGYKLVQTKFRGDYEIPKKWELSRLGNVCKFEYGKGLTEENRDNKGYFVYGSGGIVGKNSKFFTKGPGVIVARKGSLGNVFFEEGNFWPIDTVYYISKNETNHYLPFVFYLLTNLKLENYKIVTAHPGISRDEVYTIFVKIPTLDEQQKIASILSNVNSLIQQYDSIIESTKKIKTGLMQQLLTKGIGHKKFKKVKWYFGKEIEIPEEWNLKPLSQVAKVIDARHYTPRYVDKGFKLILPNNVTVNGLDLENTKFVSKRDYSDLIDGDRNPEESDIVYTRNASFGMANYVRKNMEFCLGQDMVLIKPVKIKPYLLFLILNSNIIFQQLDRLVSGSTFKRINLELIRNFLILHSDNPVEELKLVEILKNLDFKNSNLESKKTSLDKLKKGLMQKLLTGQVRVKV